MRAPRVSVCTLLWGRASGNGGYRTCTCIYNPQYPPCDITVDSLVSIYLSAHADTGYSGLRSPFSSVPCAQFQPKYDFFRPESFSRRFSRALKMLSYENVIFLSSLPPSSLVSFAATRSDTLRVNTRNFTNTEPISLWFRETDSPPRRINERNVLFDIFFITFPVDLAT